MKRLLILLLLFTLHIVAVSRACATTYTLTKLSSPSWEGTDAIRTKVTSTDYTYDYGDEGKVNYQLPLPWQFNFYGTPYNNITVNANGYIIFTDTATGHSFNLASTGMGPVIAPWNNDLSSYYYGGFFIQHKIAPERIVIEWMTETYTEEGFGRPNNFEVVLYQDGTIRFDYKSFTTQNGKDFGSGISKGDGVIGNYLNLTNIYGPVYTLSESSYLFSDSTPPSITTSTPSSVVTTSSTILAGTMSSGAIVTVTSLSSATIGAITYPTITTWNCPVSGFVSGVATDFTITATRPGSGLSQSITKSITYDPAALPVIITSPKGLLNNNTPLLDYTLLSGTVTGIKLNAGALATTNGQQLPQLADGAYTLVIEYTDGGVPGSVSSLLTIDTVAPALTIAAPPAAVHSPVLTLAGTVEANLPVAVTVSGGAAVGTVSTTGTAWTCEVTGLAIGDSTVTATAVDAAGNGMMRTATITYVPLLHTTVTPSTITAGQATTVQLAVTNLPDASATVLVEQLVDVNRNGIADSADYVIRSFTVKDGVAPVDTAIPGDSDGSANGLLAINLPSYLISDLYHAPGSYLFRISQGSTVWTSSFVVTPVLHGQTIAGTIRNSGSAVPGVMVQLADNAGRQLGYTIADENGSYTLQVAAAGNYQVTPLAYGYSADVQAVSLTTGQQAASIDLSLNSGSYHLTGRVKDSATGNGIGGVWVAANGASHAVAITATDGSYSFTLPSGTYQVAVAGDAARPNPSTAGYLALGSLPLTVTLTADSIGNDISLPKATTLVSGRTLDQSGNALVGIPVTARLSGDTREPNASRASGANGSYTLPLISGSQWSLYPDYQYTAAHNLIGSIISPYSTTGQGTGNDLNVYPVTAWVSGVVKDSANTLLGGVEVVLRNSASTIKATTLSAADGSYRIGAFAGIWYVDAFTEKIGTRSVAEQTVALTTNQTAVVDFVADVTPPDLTITAVSTPTASTSQTIGGSIEAGATVSVAVNTTAVVGVVSYPTSTTWSCTISALANGANSITVTATDAAGNSTTATTAITYNSPYPDLVVTSVAPPAGSLLAGQFVTTQVMVKNIGGVTANNTYVGLYLSSDNIITSNDFLLTAVPLTSIASGEVKVLAIESYIGYGTMKGTYYIGAIANYDNRVYEVDKTNNAMASSPVTIDYGQDLVVTSVVPSSTSMVVGQTFNVQVTVKNQGSVRSQAAYGGLYLSADTNFDGNDVLFTTPQIPSLAPGEVKLLSLDSSVSYGLTGGTYYFGFVADYNNAIKEVDKANNAKASSPVSISYGQDLVVTSVVPSSTSMVVGQTFNVQVTVKNQGSVRSQAAYGGLYLSADTNFDGNDVLFTTPQIPSLAPGEVKLLSLDSSVSYGLTGGTYYFGFVADYNNAIKEADKTNNTKASTPVTISYGQDLIVTSVVPSSTSMVTGQTFTVQARVKNIGSVSSQAAYAGLYLSGDNVINGYDTLLVSPMSANVPNLAPGEETVLTFSSYIDYYTSPGTYYFGVTADFNGRLSESNENNNTLASAPITIGYGQDLTATSITIPSGSLVSGQSVTIPVTVKNQGSVMSQQVPVTLYLSGDNVINNSDIYLGELTTTNLNPNTPQTLNFPVTIPNLAPGTYYFGVILDKNNVAKEADETNNVTVSSPTQIGN